VNSKVGLIRKKTEDALSGKLSSRKILLRKATGMKEIHQKINRSSSTNF